MKTLLQSEWDHRVGRGAAGKRKLRHHGKNVKTLENNRKEEDGKALPSFWVRNTRNEIVIGKNLQETRKTALFNVCERRSSSRKRNQNPRRAPRKWRDKFLLLVAVLSAISLLQVL